MWNEPERPLDPPEQKSLWCPLCGAENPEKIYTAPGEGPVGCDLCLCEYDAWEFFESLK